MKNNNSTLIIGLIFCALILGCGFTLLLIDCDNDSTECIGRCLLLRIPGIVMIIYAMIFPFLMFQMSSCKCCKSEYTVVDDSVMKKLENLRVILNNYMTDNEKKYNEMKAVYESCINHLIKSKSASAKNKK